jgi:hypothetical protein
MGTPLFRLLERRVGFPHAPLGQADPPPRPCLLGLWRRGIKDGERRRGIKRWLARAERQYLSGQGDRQSQLLTPRADALAEVFLRPRGELRQSRRHLPERPRDVPRLARWVQLGYPPREEAVQDPIQLVGAAGVLPAADQPARGRMCGHEGG